MSHNEITTVIVTEKSEPDHPQHIDCSYHLDYAKIKKAVNNPSVFDFSYTTEILESIVNFVEHGASDTCSTYTKGSFEDTPWEAEDLKQTDDSSPANRTVLFWVEVYY